MASLYAFSLNWLFFNIAAPAQDALYSIPIWPHYRGYFEPSLANYISRPITVALIVLFGLIVMSIVFLRKPAEAESNIRHLLFALTAYTFVRGAFFFIFNPPEALLFSPAVTLPHLLLVAVLFAATTLPAKQITLSAFAVLIFLANSTFIFLANIGPGYIQQSVTPQGWM